MADLQELQEAIGHALEAAELEALEEDPEEQHQAFAMGARERKRRRR